MAWRSSNLKPQRPDKKEARLRRKRNNYRRRSEKEPRKYWGWVAFFSFGFLTLAGLGLGLALLYYQVLTSNLFFIKDIKNIELTGLTRLQPELILELAKLGPGTNLLALKPVQAEHALETHPWIARATLTRKWPQRVHLHIQEREPTALVQVGDLYYVDQRGQLFKPLSPGDPHDYPIITGLPREFFSPTEGALPETMDRISQLMDLLKKNPPPLSLENISEIHVDLERGITLFAGAGTHPLCQWPGGGRGPGPGSLSGKIAAAGPGLARHHPKGLFAPGRPH
ncbi:MAG: FtsQ-type POTRA domain-containing protein [Deltaproteobacteria bacterium]|nr:FtsQ-type POTRA domain-containing protein [Deltaproteobacteria bacterium]